jgi:uncharacterized RDD family membrane protein YckC
LSSKRYTIEVDSGQGIGFELRIAGLGARAFAFIIDWHIRFLAAISWFALIVLMRLAFPGLVLPEPLASLLAPVPAVLVYFLYHPVLELLMDGNTPGKQQAGIRVVTTSGHVPTRGAIMVRNVLRLVDSAPMLYVFGIASCMATDLERRVGDVAAGTLLVYAAEDGDDILEATFLVGSEHSVEALNLARTLVARWRQLEDASRITLARKLLAKMGQTDLPNRPEDLLVRIEGLVP